MFHYQVDDDSELRLLEERHAESLLALIERNRERHPEIPQLHTLEDARGYIRRDLDLFADNKGLGIGIWHRGKLAGAVRYHEIDWTNRSTELGYWLGADFEGRGLVTKACGVLLEHAFKELGLNRVVISCAAENTRSRAVAGRLGFTQEGVRRQAELVAGRFVDQAIYALLAYEWRGLS
ncbi:MAG TPA: GNAT family protein [Pyrinomonadaceae bacterium]|jgi:ribosomal-protein-serine acetyltransferase